VGGDVTVRRWLVDALDLISAAITEAISTAALVWAVLQL
jgi:hypothetical protein